MSVTRQRMSRAPPMAWSIVTWSMMTLPNSLVSFVVRGRNSSIFCLRVSFRAMLRLSSRLD